MKPRRLYWIRNRIDVLVIVRRRGDEFGAIQYRTTADGEQEGDVLFTGDFHRVHQRFVRGVWFNPAKLQNVEAVQGVEDLIEHAGFFHAAAAVGHQNPGIRRDLVAQVSDGAFTKQDAGWGM